MAETNAKNLERLLDRIYHGASSVWIAGKLPSLAEFGLRVVNVDLARADSAVVLAQQLLVASGHALGVHPARWVDAAERGVRRQLFEQRSERPWGQALMLALRELGSAIRGTGVLCFERLEAATPEVAALVSNLIPHCEALSLPVVLTFDPGFAASQPGRAWIEALAARFGTEAVLLQESKDQEAPPAERRDAAMSAGDAPEPELGSEGPTSRPGRRLTPEPTATRGERELGGAGLSDEVLHLLRVVAAADGPVPVDALARVCGLPVLAVLERLQRAKDCGVPIRDDGSGHIFVSDELRRALLADLLPSLAATYRREVDSAGSSAHAAGERADSKIDVGREEAGPGEPTTVSEGPSAAAVPSGSEPQSEPALEPASEPLAVESLLARELEQAVAMGLYAEAIESGEKILAGLEATDASAHDAGDHEVGRENRILVQVALARAHLLGAGLVGSGDTPELGLAAAREVIEAAEALVEPGDPLDLIARVVELRAEVLYEIGSLESLQLALEALSDLSRRYLEHGKPVSAARLLNDQAAIELRLGDPVRAHRLLESARDVFGERAPGDPEARVEMAQTEHLMARLVLHVQARPGYESEALERALGHAHTAEGLYTEFGRKRELARVHETIGRLEAKLAHPTRARAALVRAAGVQQEIGDVLGLARTAGALAELSVELGQTAAALELLTRSVQLNAQVGSVLGLRHNRESLERLRSFEGLGSAAELHALDQEIERAESRISAPAAMHPNLSPDCAPEGR